MCRRCNFVQPDDQFTSKSRNIKDLFRSEKSVAATHSLFYLLDDEALEIIKEKEYCLIVDESISVISRLNIAHDDFLVITEQLAEVGKEGRVRWRNPDYRGTFVGYKELADASSLYRLDSSLLHILNPDILRAFNEVFMLTYLFNGQYQKGYLDYFGFGYNVIGVQEDEYGYHFSPYPDAPPPIDYGSLIHIVGKPKMNKPGSEKYSLSKQWYTRHSYDDPAVKSLRNGLRNFFQDITKSSSDDRIWTCFKADRNKLIDKKTGRFRNNFLQLEARATNDYRNKKYLAYMVNRFIDPNLKKLFAQKGCIIDDNSFALAEMLQWIWRSAIREDNPIELYLPSNRMRKLLTDWIEVSSKGGIGIGS